MTWSLVNKLTHESDGTFTAHASEQWLQGRSLFGGLLGAQLIAAMKAHPCTEGRPLRGLSLQFVAPAIPGDGHIVVEVLRSGKLMTMVQARWMQDSHVMCQAVASFGKLLSNERILLPPLAPEVPPFDPDIKAVWLPDMPTFCQFFDYRFVLGAEPFSSAERGEVGGWIRPIEPVLNDEGLIVHMLDAFPPTIWPMAHGPRPAATIDMSVQFLWDEPPGDMKHRPYLYHGETIAAGAGYFEEEGWLWSDDGLPVARTRQMGILPPMPGQDKG